MSSSRNFRWVLIGKMFIRNHGSALGAIPSFNLGDLASLILNSRRLFNKEEKIMWCKDIDETDNYYKILMCVGDKNVSIPSFVDFNTLQSRDIRRNTNEGEHFCSHILIFKNPDQYGRHTIIIEKVTNISLSSIQSHFNWILSRDQNKKTGNLNGEYKIYSGTTEILGFQSTTLQEAISSGSLQDIEFVGIEEIPQGLDEDDVPDEYIKTAKIKLNRRIDRSRAPNLMQRAIQKFREFLPESDASEDKKMLVRIKSESGQIRTGEVLFNSDDLNDAAIEALENKFVLNEFIKDFSPPLTQGYDSIRDDVIEKLMEIHRNIE